MTEEKGLRPLSSYLEFGVRLHWEDFTQLTAGMLAVYLPFSSLVFFIHPSVEAIVKQPDGMAVLLPRIFISQLLLRVLQTFVLIMIILRIEERRKSGKNIWDFSEAFLRIKRVALVDLAYVFGLQMVGVTVFLLSLMVAGILMGESPLALPVAFTISAFVVIGPGVRYYFASFVSLLYATRFSESFRRAAVVSSGGERLVVSLVMTFLLIWFVVWQVAQGIFGGGIFGQVIVQAGVMTTSIPYFIAGYLLFRDLVPPGADESAAGGKEIAGMPEPPEVEPGGDKAEEDYPPVE